MRSRTIWAARVLVGVVLAVVSAAGAQEVGRTVSLAGQWRFWLDREDAGIKDRVFERELAGKVSLPGSLPAQGIGDNVSVNTKWTGGIVDRSWFTAPQYEKYRQSGNVKVPFWLQPEKYYVGAAWYQRDIEIPADWQGKRVVLVLERPHWETRVWLDEKPVGTNNALGTPHEHELGLVSPGKHRLTIRVDNRMVVDVGPDSHSVSDHTQGNWNGIVGKIELRATEPVWIDDLQVYPQVASKSVKVKGRIGNITGKAGRGKVSLDLMHYLNSRPAHGRQPVDVSWDVNGGEFEAEMPIGPERVELWSEFNPVLYDVYAWMNEEPRPVKARFGFREISTQGTQFILNGQKIFFRGTLECCIFPKTGHPPTDVDSWRRIIGIAKAHGLNNIRFHSWCPPEAAFVAADELGFYYQVECSSWANSTTGLGQGKPIDNWIYEEADRILRYYGNHPSFMLMPYGNEPGGNFIPFLKQWVAHYKQKDARRLYTSASGWPQIPENQFHVTPDPRIQAWGGGLKSRINARPPETRTDYRDYVKRWNVPVISHEIGQWCVYPNFDEIAKYTGYLKPRNFEIFRDTLESRGMGDLAHKFLLASGKLQTLCYKEDIESALRTPGMGGFQLLDLHDFPGQGTALVGVLDPFWEDKGYVTAEQFRRFCNSTVPLARLSKRVFTNDEALTADIEVANFGPRPIENAVAAWKLVAEDGKAVARGQLPSKTIAVDNGIELGSISVGLKGVPAPAKYKLVVSLEGTKFENDWDVWVYPPAANVKPPAGITIAHDLDEKTAAALESGGKVLLLIPPTHVKNVPSQKVMMGFSSIFWNTAWTRRQAPTTLGILCDPKHPALAEFPTEYHSNWQWWYLISRAAPMILDDLPANVRPVVQVIDDWVTAHRLGLILEAKVGKGRVVVCSIDLKNGLEQNPVARQLLHSLLSYMDGEQFKPSAELTAEQIRSLTGDAPGLVAKVKSATASSHEQGFEPDNAIDGNPETMWHSAWTPNVLAFPHELKIELKQPTVVCGFTALPRQDRNRNGIIKDFEFYVSGDGKNWGQPAAKGTFSDDAKLKTIMLAAPKQGKFIRLVALSGYASGPWASLAELELIGEPKPMALWPGQNVEAGAAGEQVKDLTPGKLDRFISNVRIPTLTVYLPPKEKATGAAVIICPGGAYVGVAIDREGHDVARWLNSIGVAGIVLKYRMPNGKVVGDEKPWPLQDAQRAIRFVRSRAQQWNLDPHRIGIMGFSAGGHLASTAATHFDAGNATAADLVERQSCRPDFLILGYPVVTFKPPIAHEGSRVNLIGKDADQRLLEEYSNELHVTAQTPPTFIVHAKDDGVKVANSIQFEEACRKAGVPCELQLYEKGGHGYGLGMNGGEVATWPQRCAEWMKRQKLLGR